MKFSLEHLKSAFSAQAKKSAVQNPARDWLILLCVVVLLFVGSAIWNYFAFQSSLATDVSTSADVSVPAIKSTPIEDIQAIFAKREQKQIEYQTPKTFVDPSL